MPPNLTIAVDDVLIDTQLYRIRRIIAFNRLETRPRTTDFTRSLRAEVRDPLWMLTRQWQFGEFNGEDAASPVTSRIAYQHEMIDRVTFPGGEEFALPPLEMPLETRVERELVPLAVRETGAGELFSDMLFAVQWGKQFLRLLQAAGLQQAHYPRYLEHFPLRVLPGDPEAEQIRSALRGRIADGVAIWRAVETGAHATWLDSLDAPPLSAAQKSALTTAAAGFAGSCAVKFKRLFTQPEGAKDTAWLPNHLEYQFQVAGAPTAVSAAGGPAAVSAQTVLLAEQYHQGRLDWYSFDASTRREESPLAPPALPLTDAVESFLPANVRFKGQPQARFWEMEETQTDFGKIETSTTGLLHLLLAEFGLIYSNDWFMLPHPMPVNTVCEIRGILVDDTFGRHTLIRPAGRGPETQWQRWAMFHLTEKELGWTAANRFYLVPAVGKVLESEPLERVNFMRDEMANMVWAIEAIVPSQTGKSTSGYEAAPPGAALPPLPPATEEVKIGYVLGTTVPKNWTPFIAMHAEGSVSEIRLQRARIVGGQPPRGRLLREPGSPYFVEEEEVPRAGIYVERSWQRARWLGGRTFIWLGRRKTAGRGEGWSQLVFDQIVDLQPK